MIVKPVTLFGAARESRYSLYGTSNGSQSTDNSPGNDYYPSTGGMTWEMWVKRRPGVDLQNNLVHHYYYDGTYTEWPYTLNLRSSGARVYAYVENTSFLQDEVYWGPIPTSGWVHLAWVWRWGLGSSAARHTLYVNGVNWDANRTVVTNTALGDMYRPATNSDFFLGHDVGHAYYLAQQYNIDEIRMWNDERTQPEISDNMYQHVDPLSANLKRYYRCEQNLNDEISATANLTPTFIAYSTDTPF